MSDITLEDVAKKIEELAEKLELLKEGLKEVVSPTLYKFQDRFIPCTLIERVYDSFVLENKIKPNCILVPERWTIAINLGTGIGSNADRWGTHLCEKNIDYHTNENKEDLIYLEECPIYYVRGLKDIRCIQNKGEDKAWEQFSSPLKVANLYYIESDKHYGVRYK